VITVVTALAVIVCVARGHRWLAWWLVPVVAGSAITNSLAKVVAGRVRPSTAGLETSAQGFAFPSGHTQAATVTFVAVVLVVGWTVGRPARWLRRASCVAVVVLVAAVGLSRVLLGAHWPSDVLGGWLLGSAWVTAVTVVLNRRRSGQGLFSGPASVDGS
jgi:undecaprenyl-diphosphatase